MSTDYSSTLPTLLLQEQDLQFLTFDSLQALDLGLFILKNAKTKQYPVVISITLNNHLLFHYAMPGTTPADAEAVHRKIALVSQFHHSSYYVGQWLRHQGNQGKATLAEVLPATKNVGVDGTPKEYVASTAGGAFPLLIKGVGVVGAICASRIDGHIEDHELVVSSLKDFLGIDKEGKNKVE